MYRIGEGHEHLGPGTSLVQRINWTTGDEAEMVAGLGCACSGKCGKSCGLGLFDNGLDPSSFGAAEWGIVAGAAYVLFSTVFTTRSAVRGAREKVRTGRRRLGKKIAG